MTSVSGFTVLLLTVLVWREKLVLAANQLETNVDEILRRFTQCNVAFPDPG